ncbi:substrate-binding periplasmic protein [Undibacterium pigrum]|uniref:Amino acid ABC transporter substrate-binding protein (PAAT family) n=1 Tax=Undibacterium pigrum TaxID=401470 RepID=A0A318JD56_9BURK|nr:transporter substrate-binding domain-containing protein [Undibacterium pigrum]PXX47528.1 amino acid ABC transporter substrate-binding protein (PAAT family) [Undibacterium pigrum]
MFRQKTKCAFTFATFALFALLAGSAHAGQVLAVGTEFANVFERSPNGEFTGLGADIIRMLARQNGDEVKFEIYPWARAQWMVEHEQAQILIGPYKTVEREAKYGFAKRAFYRDVMALYIRKGSDVSWDGNYASLPGQRLGVINGWVYGQQFESLRSGIKPVIANTLTNGLNMLMAKRVDFLATNMRNTEATMKTMGISDEMQMIEPFMDMQDGYLAYCKSIACEQLRLRYDELYEQLRDGGVLQLMARRLGVRLPP